MTEDTKTVVFSLAAIIGLMAFLVVVGNNMAATGQSIGGHHDTLAVNYPAQQPQTITATGSFGGLGNGKATLTFGVNTGPATGTFSGDYVSGPIKAIYNGQLIGTFAGGEGGIVSGKMNGRGQILSGNQQQGWQPITGTFTGVVNFARGTVTGNWAGSQSGGVFNLKFNPVQGVQPAAPVTTTPGTVTQYGTTTSQAQATLGYCRCIREGYSSGGSEVTPYGGIALEFKGFMTMQNCINTCGATKYSWRER